MLMSNFLRNSHTKNHLNQLIFDRVIGKIKGGAGVFCGHSVVLTNRAICDSILMIWEFFPVRYSRGFILTLAARTGVD